ncbi:MAG: trypsin-like serine protease, partial [Halobacteriovoraceae bacterium]|nr:trypsin-like serine protease [Halobacteriovoraceae bacterium]
MKINGIILIFLMSCSSALGAFSSTQKIIGGLSPESDNPGQFNTVALVKEEGKVFCTGSLVARDLVVTAKHCLMDKENVRIRIYFGDDTTKPDPDLYRNVTEYKVRYPVDWTMTFPSFDVAWVKFEGSLPATHRPLPVLSHISPLEVGSTITQVGYGDHNPSAGQVDAGIKLTGKTIFKEYIDNPRFFHILLFHGAEGQGSCHGDSGGPAYAKIDGQWFIVGVTNGFDVVLTPETMARSGDPDFPYRVDCSKNQSLYSFLGAHGSWIEETSGTNIYKSDEFFDYDRDNNALRPNTLKEWCLSRDYGSPQWNLLKILMDIKVDSLPQGEAVDFYQDCEQVESYLSEMEEISLDKDEVMEGRLSFETLNLFPKLKTLKLYNFPDNVLNLSSIKGLELEELTLQNVGIKNLKFIQANKVKKLSVQQNPLYSLSGIEMLQGLESLNVSGTPLKDLAPASRFPLKELIAVGINSSVIFGADKIDRNL